MQHPVLKDGSIKWTNKIKALQFKIFGLDNVTGEDFLSKRSIAKMLL